MNPFFATEPLYYNGAVQKGDFCFMNNTDNIRSLPSYLFHEGTNYHSEEYLGLSVSTEDGRREYTFRVWAPNADSVFLVGDFTSWETVHK